MLVLLFRKLPALSLHPLSRGIDAPEVLSPVRLIDR